MTDQTALLAVRRTAAPSAAGAKHVTNLPWPVLIYLFVVVIPIGFQVGPLMLTMLRLLLLVMILPLILKLFRGQYGGIFVTDILFILHIGWAALALALNNPAQVVEQIGSVGMEFLGGYLIGRACIRTSADFVALCRCLMVIVCAFLPLAVFETLTGRPLIMEAIRSLPGVTSTVAVNGQAGRMGLERVQLSFEHPIHYGLFCSIAFSLTFVGLRGVISGPTRYLASAVIGLCGFLALSSGALLALALQLGLIAWAWVFSGFRHRWLLLLGFFGITYVVIDLLSNRTPIQVFMSYATFSAHTAHWRGIIFEWGMKNVWANPLFGLGLNDWVRPSFMYSGSMDNFWLVMALRYGIPGFILLALGYAIALWRVARRDFSADPVLTQLRLAWVFSFLGLTFTLCTVHIFVNIYSFVFFFFGAGFWLIMAQPAGGPPPTETGSKTGVLAPLNNPASALEAPPSLPPPEPGKTKNGPRYSRFPVR